MESAGHGKLRHDRSTPFSHARPGRYRIGYITGNPSRPKAYSLLEMIIACFIYSAVAMALAGVFSYHYRAIGTSRLFLIGQHLARDRADECVAAGFLRAQQLDNGGVPPPPVTVEFVIRDQVIQTAYTIATDVALDPNPPGHRMCSVTVSWAETNRIRRVRFCAELSPEA